MALTQLTDDSGQGDGSRVRSALVCDAAIVPTIAGLVVIHLDEEVLEMAAPQSA